VHFTVGLLSIAVLLFIVSQFISEGKLREQIQLVAVWNLWLGAGITVLTVAAGVMAYNSVAHDTPSHEAMTVHRNWALVTATLFIALAIWSWLRARASLGVNKIMLIALLVGVGLLASSAWRGGELVYRYGLGVMSLPKADTHGHTDDESHDHGSEKIVVPDSADDDQDEKVHDNSDGHHDTPQHDNTDGHAH
jgi:uncharacterized membrane protein